MRWYGNRSSVPLQSGIASLVWGAGGFSLLLAEARAAGPSKLLELSFAHSLPSAHRVQHFGTGGRAAAQSQQNSVREAHLLLVSMSMPVLCGHETRQWV
jgi:hypothetical protein